MMHCEHLRVDDGSIIAIVCGGERQPRCACGAKSGFQCDWKLGAGVTCDKHICTEHAQEVGENKNLCPGHQQAYRQWLAAREGRLSTTAVEQP